MGLYQLVYQSLSLVRFEQEDLARMLAHCCAYNLRHNITGILLHTADGRFFQVLEGEEADVRKLYFERILPNPRHFHCHIFSEGPCDDRTFAHWPMGFRLASAQDLRKLLSQVPPDIPGLLVPRPHTRPELMALLQEFVETCGVAPYLEHPWQPELRQHA